MTDRLRLPDATQRLELIAARAKMFLTPPAATASERAEAASQAARCIDDATRMCLRAGIASAPNDEFVRKFAELEIRIIDEAEAIIAFGNHTNAEA